MDRLTVFISSRDSICEECGENLGHKAWITLNADRQALCHACADLDHLIFLPSGDTALTRRAGKKSPLTAVVVKWSGARKRYERQGLLVGAEALELAEQECLADKDARVRRQQRAAERRAELDEAYVRHFAAQVWILYPNCPPGREHEIAEHACLKYSGRVGRSAAAKALDEAAIRAAVTAHVRHAETPYDTLLGKGWDRFDARQEVAGQSAAVLASWEQGA
jgi:hypothetical protein